MKQMLDISRHGATYETSRSALLGKESSAVTATPQKRPPRPRMEFSLQNEQFKGLLWQVLVIGIAVIIIG
jgi:hypothetical protein